MGKEKAKKIIVNETLIVDLILIIIAIATACSTIGLLGGFLYRNPIAICSLAIGIAIIVILYFLLKHTKIREAIKNAKPHKVTKRICYTIIAISLLILFVFITACITLFIINILILLINGLTSLYQAIF